MKIYAQMDPKSHPKIDIWAIRGPTFEVFGRVLRNAILNTFSIGKNLAIFCKNLRFECELGVRWRSSGSEGAPKINFFWYQVTLKSKKMRPRMRHQKI